CVWPGNLVHPVISRVSLLSLLVSLVLGVLSWPPCLRSGSLWIRDIRRPCSWLAGPVFRLGACRIVGGRVPFLSLSACRFSWVFRSLLSGTVRLRVRALVAVLSVFLQRSPGS